MFISPDGNNEEQVEKMIYNAKRISEVMRTIHAYRHEAWIGLTTMALKSLEYCLPTTTISQKDCDKIMWELLKVLIPKFGVNRKLQETYCMLCLNVMD